VYQPAGTDGVAGWAGAVGVEDGVELVALEPQPPEELAPLLDPQPLSVVDVWPHDDPLDDDSGAVPQPDGSLTGAPESPVAGSAAADEARVAADADPAEPLEPSVAPDDERFTKAVMSLPAGTMATTSHPAADFSESFAASEAAS
jgi:hypothetical protein